MDFVITDYVSIEEAYDKMIEYEKNGCIHTDIHI